MDLGFAGKCALVTGGSRGIGKAITQALSREGCRVVSAARADADIVADVSTEEGAKQAVTQAIAKLGHLDILVNNVGGSLGSGRFELATAAEWKAVLDTNLMSAVWCSQEAVAHMIVRGGGSIIHINSICGREFCSSSAYTAAKAAMTALTKEMAITLSKHKIRVNGVAPGSIMFPGGTWEARQKADPERIERMIENDLPWGRFGTPDEVAHAVAFLASNKASWITGATLPVDGAQGRAF